VPSTQVKLQDYLFKQADKPAALWLVFFLTMCDSIFLFIPPEIFMTPPIIANRKKAFRVVMAASIGSLVGAIIAYMIGVWLYDTIAPWIIETFSSPEQFAMAKSLFIKYGLWIVVIGSFTPIPYKLLTLAAGFVRFNPILYLGTTAIGRALRFAVFGYLLWRYQDQAQKIVKKYFWPLTIGAIVAAIIGIALLSLL